MPPPIWTSTCACAEEAKDAGLPVVIGMEVDYYPGRMDEVSTLLADYPFDVLLGSVHWLGAWRFDDLDVPLQMDEWSIRQVDACWERVHAARWRSWPHRAPATCWPTPT